jgi:hypothetical protein
MQAMRRGDFACAWSISDRVLATRDPHTPNSRLPRHEQAVWDGRPLQGRRVLVRCYHGLGDTLQFARFLPRLDSIVGETIVWVQPALMGLLATLPGNRRLLPLHDGTPDAAYEVDLEIMELAHALRVTPESLSSCVPYFDVDPAPRASEKFGVGVLAEAGEWDPRRSLPIDVVDRLTGEVRVELFNLQLERPLPSIRDLSTSDVLTLARRLRSLDLVITPDTMLAHLAGALAVPTWTLLPADADWRWMGSERTDTPWYPTMRLFRQRQAHDWSPLLEEVRTRLSSMAAACGPPDMNA